MPWARIDDDIYDHPKITELLDEPEGWAAFGFWTACLAWAHKHTRRPGKTPGYLPRRDVVRMDRTVGVRYAGLLCKVGLWVPSGDDGWLIHDFGEYLPKPHTSAVRAAAGRAGGLKSAQVRATKAEERSTELQSGSTELPESKQELPATGSNPEANAGTGRGSSKNLKVAESSVSGRAARATRIPDDFGVTPEMVQWARQRVPRVDGKLETEKFINYWTAKAGRDASKTNWVRTWQNWMLSAAERLPGAPAAQTRRAGPHEEHRMRR
jgi:hypothetical protein